MYHGPVVRMRSADESSWTVVVKTGVLAVGSWQEPCTSCWPSKLVSFKQSEARGRHKQWKTWCSAPHRWKNSGTRSTSISRLQTTFRPITMERSRRSDTAADWRLRGTRWSASCVSRLSCQLIVANIETGKLEHGNGTVEEPVGQPLMTWHRASLDSGAAGSSVFSQVSDYGDKQLTTHRSGSRFGGDVLRSLEQGCRNARLSV